MTDQQLQHLINEIIQLKRDLINKLEEIRRGGIDIETALENLKKIQGEK